MVRLGEPVRAEALLAGASGDRRIVMDAIGLAVARLLPPAYRGVYGHADQFPGARELLRESAATG
jgi:hypothetical protein